MAIRGLRGATVAATNDVEAIGAATRELLLALQAANQFGLDDVASIFFTATPDLNAAPPARAARELGWNEAAMLCLTEMETLGGLPRCIRVLIHWNTELPQHALQHIYLREAALLRPDRVLPAGSAVHQLLNLSNRCLTPARPGA